jgi:hypothetical protein
VFKVERPNCNSAASALAGLIPGIWLGAVLLLFIALPSVPAGAQTQSREENTDRPGRDLNNFNLNFASPGTLGGPEDVCRETCQRTAQCKAWTFVKAGFQGPTPRCWLKNAIPAPRASNCCVSGVPVHSLEAEVDRPGSDYANFDLASANADLCKAACEKDGTKCKAWTFTKAGVQGPQARCWLKNAIPPASTSTCCTSGVRDTIVH